MIHKAKDGNGKAGRENQARVTATAVLFIYAAPRREEIHKHHVIVHDSGTPRALEHALFPAMLPATFF